MSPDPIVQICLDPRVTRDRAALGELVPCYRCLAHEPETETGCRFLEKGITRLEAPEPVTGEQSTLFPASDTMETR